MFFRNLKLFHLGPSFPDATTLAASLARHPLQPCGSLDTQSLGWVPPRGNAEEYLVDAGGHCLVALGSERKVLPAAVIRKQVEQWAQKIETEEGEKPGRKRLREIKDQVTDELLAKAFAKPGGVTVWIDPSGRWLGINAASMSRVDEVVEMLAKAEAGALLAPINLSRPTHAALTEWLLAGEAPGRFTIDRDCELQEPTEQKSAVRYTRHNLDSTTVRAHVESGKRVTRLALTWNDRISFVLCEDLSIKRLSFLDILKEQSEQDAGEASDAFGADLAIMGGELRQMADELVQALGGEAVEDE